MGDILKEAIADAKAVRETALENAKIALEEAFTPQLKSMLSAKLKEDELEEGEPVLEDEEEEADDDEEEVPAEEGTYEDEEFGDDEHGDEEGGDEEVPAGDDDFGDDEDEDDVDEGIIEINGVQYAPVVSEEEDEEESDEEEVDESNLDLEAVIKELEDEISEEEESNGDEEITEDESEEEDSPVNEDDSEQEYEIDESLFTEEEDEESDEEEKVDEQSQTSGIGSGDNKVNYASNKDEEDIDGTGVKKAEFKEVYDELNQYKEAVGFLKDKLHEVNILNAKLLFTNKLFKEFILDNDQKLKVVENFDRAQTVREIKLVYSTIAEQLQENSNVSKKKIVKESVGGSSKSTGSTKPSNPKKIISEENKVADRFKKLAGLIK
jgi:hypothetical protein|tara:strand:- start:1498 stop:2637 length:1140 start_codon:yes stop_codon:yes gene_type:complete